MRFEDTIRLQKGRLLSFVRSRVGSTEDAEDIVQDVFFRLAEGNIIETIEDVSAYLFRSARNKIIDLYRKRSRSRQVSAEMDSQPGKGNDEAEAREWTLRFWEEFESALLDLPDEQREVFELQEMQGKTFREISEQTGENINTLLSRKRYAVLVLRERLRGLFDEMMDER